MTTAVAALVVTAGALVATAAPSGADGAERSRLAGPNRYATAAAISQEAFPDGSDRVYLARSSAPLVDALAGGALTDGPILLVPPCGEVPAATGQEIERTNPDRVVALGGSSAICDRLLQVAAAGRASGRLAGATRYATAVQISQRAFPGGAQVVYLARGADPLVDALAGGALTDGPVLLVPPCGDVPDVVLDEISRLDPAQVVALGGAAAVCDRTLRQAAAGRTDDRLAGNDRYATAARIARHAHPDGAEVAYLARGVDPLVDALAGGTLNGGPVLLVPPDGEVPGAVATQIRRLSPARIVALGGPGAVSNQILAHAAGAPGTTDTDFGDGGLASWAPRGDFANYWTDAALVGSDGTIVVGAHNSRLSSEEDKNYPTHEITMVRFTAGGQLDPSFGGDGTVTTALAPPNRGGAADGNGIKQIFELADGSYLVGAVVFSDPEERETPPSDGVIRIVMSPEHFSGHLVRYRPDGSLDSSFGNGGTVKVAQSAAFNTLGLHANGDVVVVDGQDGTLQLSRFDTNGTRGPTDTFRFPVDYMWPTIAQVDGQDRLLVAGTSKTGEGNDSDWFVARFLPDGTLDTTFGDNGFVTVQEEDSLTDPSMALSESGIYLSGSLTDPQSEYHVAVARLREDGTRDPSFGQGGLATMRADQPTGYWRAHAFTFRPPGHALAEGCDGNLYVAVEASNGFADNPQPGRDAWGVVAFGPDGDMDTDFGLGGLWVSEHSADAPTGVTLGGDCLLYPFGYVSPEDTDGPNSGVGVARVRTGQ